MPKRVQQKQKQKQTVVVNINSTKTKTRTKRKSSKKHAGSQQQVIRQQLPPPIHQIYTSPIHNLVPQVYAGGNRLNIPTLAEQQINNKTNEAMKAEMDKSLIQRMNKTNDNFSIPSSNATANSSSSSKSLTDYGSSNSPSLNSLAYFRNQHSDSSLGSTMSMPNQYKYDLNDSDSISELSSEFTPVREYEDSIKRQYDEVIEELSSNPIMKEQPDNRSLGSSIDSEIQYYAEKRNDNDIDSLQSNPIMREQPENRSLASLIDNYNPSNQPSVFDRFINAPVGRYDLLQSNPIEQSENRPSLFDTVVNPTIQRRMTDYFNVGQPPSNLEQPPSNVEPRMSGQPSEISAPLTYKMKKKNPKI